MTKLCFEKKAEIRILSISNIVMHLTVLIKNSLYILTTAKVLNRKKKFYIRHSAMCIVKLLHIK